MAVAFHRRDQTGQDRFEAFPTDAIGSLPDNDERVADRLRRDLLGRDRSIVAERAGSGEQPNGLLAMAAGEGNEFIQYSCFITLG